MTIAIQVSASGIDVNLTCKWRNSGSILGLVRHIEVLPDPIKGKGVIGGLLYSVE